MISGRNLSTLTLASVAALALAVAPASAEAVISPLPNGTFASANDINNSGVIVGNRSLSATKWSPDGTVTTLGLLPGMQITEATAINNHGTIGGVSGNDGQGAATLWAPNGTPRALASPPGFSSCWVTAINDGGVVAGTCSPTNSNDEHAVRWNTDGTVLFLPFLPEVPHNGGYVSTTSARTGQSSA